MSESTETLSYSSPLVELVEKIVGDGRITHRQERIINDAIQQPLDNLDLMAITRLRDLIREGAVRVA